MKEESGFLAESIEIIGKTALSAIPVGGTLISCVWDSIKANAAQKRLDEWKEMIENRLSRVENNLEAIGKNELFSSAMMRATDIAIKTAENEKREYLANAVYHTVNVPIEEGILMIYLDFLERYSVWHLQVLHFFQKPRAYVKEESISHIMGSSIDVLMPIFPELCENTDLILKIVNDLQMDGLMARGNYMNTMMTENGMLAPRTTKMGNDFLNYILTDSKYKD